MRRRVFLKPIAIDFSVRIQRQLGQEYDLGRDHVARQMRRQMFANGCGIGVRSHDECPQPLRAIQAGLRTDSSFFDFDQLGQRYFHFGQVHAVTLNLYDSVPPANAAEGPVGFDGCEVSRSEPAPPALVHPYESLRASQRRVLPVAGGKMIALNPNLSGLTNGCGLAKFILYQDRDSRGSAAEREMSMEQTRA